MIEFVSKYGYNAYSQNREDGVIMECLLRMDYWPGHAVEIGGNDGRWMSNTCNLLNPHGIPGKPQPWTVLFVEADYDLYLKCKANHADNPRVRVQCCHVDGKNINVFVDERCDVFSSDTDGADYEIFKGLKSKPKIVIVEIDSSIPPGQEGFNSDGAAGYRTMAELGISKGYFLLCHTGNLVFVDKKYRELFPEIIGDGLSNSHLYFNQSWLKKEAA